MNITLYKATHDLRELLDQVDLETGELPEGLEKAQIDFHGKAEAVIAYILETEAEVKLLRARANAICDLADLKDGKAFRLREYLLNSMQAIGVQKIVSDDQTYGADLFLDRDKSIEVLDDEALPNDYKRLIPESYKADKKAIKEAIERGEEVPGARLVKKHRLVLG